MTTLKAKYTTMKTIENNYFDRNEFDAWMNEFTYVTRTNYKMDCIEIVDIESGEVVDYAHPIAITHNGERHYTVMLSEMETNWELNGELFCTITDELEFSNYPTSVRKALRK